MRVRKVNSNDIKIHDSVQVKLKTVGNTSAIQFTVGNNKICTVRNLSKDTYIDTRTGEVKQKKKSESRYQSPKTVRKSINRLMDLIHCNATEKTHCKWLTLTYADAVTDYTKVYEDFDAPASFIENGVIAKLWGHTVIFSKQGYETTCGGKD